MCISQRMNDRRHGVSEATKIRICAIGLRGIPDVMGGIETHCENLYGQMQQADPGIAVTVIGRSPYAEAGNFGGVEVRTTWAPRQKFLETLLHTPLALLYARTRLQADVIHLHGIGPGFYAPLARLLGFRLVSTHHALDYDRPKWGLFGKSFLKSGEFMLARFSERIICVSDVVRSAMLKKHDSAEKKSVTIRNGAPPPPEDLPPSGEVLNELGLSGRPFVLAVGRLDSTKGFDILIDAFNASHLSKTHYLAIAGGGQDGDPYVQQLEDRAGPSVKFLGRQPATRVRRLLETTDLFVHASRLEGFPLVVMEALGAGAPILISDIGPHLEVGLAQTSYFPDGDTAQLQAQLDQGDFSRFRAEAAEGILEETSWPNLARQHVEVFRGLLATT